MSPPESGQRVDIGHGACRMGVLRGSPSVRSPRRHAPGDASNPPTDGSRDGPAVNGDRDRGPVARIPTTGAWRMIVGVPRESFPGERRVALVPSVIPNLAKAGMEVIVQ